ncbi:MAG: ribose ABC transporter permease, partial [Eubacteriales bacterium]|nr:ribose ABC transporter permease [Eubacteriales bacterium]
TSISGGKGNAMGVLFGAVLVGVLTNIMTLLNVNSYYQQVMRGVVLILAIGIDVLRTTRENRA